MGQGASLSKEPHVVVVGGGYSGTALCKELLKAKSNFTLVDSRDAFHHNVASVRAIVKPGSGFIAKTMIPYDGTFGSHFKKGKMVKVDPESNTIELEGGERITYDVLVIATGTGGHFPAKFGHMDRSQAIQQYETYAQKVKSANRISIVGGGAVGVEIAGEIATEYSDKEITLISNTEQLVSPDLKQGFYKKVDAALEALKVKVIRGEKVTNLDQVEEGPATLYTDNHSSIETDLIIRAIGLSVNKEAYQDGLGHVSDQRGALQVKKTLQVEGYENIFAMGDCAKTGDDNVSFLAMVHAKFVVKNLSKLQKQQALLEYKGHDHMFKIGLTVGKNYGFGQLKNGMMLPDFVIKNFKGKDMMVSDFWKKMGQKAPK